MSHLSFSMMLAYVHMCACYVKEMSAPYPNPHHLLKLCGKLISILLSQAVGLMLGDFPDEFTVNVVDVFPMPPGTVRATFTNALFSPLLSYKPFFLERVLIYVQGVSVEAFGIPDPVPEGSVRPPCYPLDMIDKLKETGRLETVVGW